MSTSRVEYFDDLLGDCIQAVEQRWGTGDGEGRAQLVAALIISDSLNGLRKAMLQQGAAFAPRNAMAAGPGTRNFNV